MVIRARTSQWIRLLQFKMKIICVLWNECTKFLEFCLHFGGKAFHFHVLWLAPQCSVSLCWLKSYIWGYTYVFFILQPTLSALCYHFKTGRKSLMNLYALWDLIIGKSYLLMFFSPLLAVFHFRPVSCMTLLLFAVLLVKSKALL